MNADLREFEKQFNSWKHSWDSRKDLDYLNLDSVAKSDLTHNLRITAYRVDLGNKTIFGLCKQTCFHILDLKTKLQEQSDDLQGLKQLSEVVCSQRRDLKQLLALHTDLKQEVLQLRKEYLNRRPLSKKDVEDLVLQISQQPKLIERQTEALTEELSRKIDKVEELIHHLRESILG